MLSLGLIHLANIIYLASYAVKDIRVLRWLTILGIALLIPYYLSYELWTAATWNVVFLVINLIRLRSRTTATHSRASAEPMRHHEKSSSVSPAIAPGMCPEVNGATVWH